MTRPVMLVPDLSDIEAVAITPVERSTVRSAVCASRTDTWHARPARSLLPRDRRRYPARSHQRASATVRPCERPMAAWLAARRAHRSACTRRRSLGTARRASTSAWRLPLTQAGRGQAETLSRRDLLAQACDEPVGHRRLIAGASKRIGPLTVGQTREQAHRPPNVAWRDAVVDECFVDCAVVELDVPIGDAGDEATAIEQVRVVLTRIETARRP